MRRQFPFIGETPGLIDGEHIRRQGKASRLFGYFVTKQTAPDGTVNYGRPMTYAQIAKEIPNGPPRRTMRRWTARLREHSYIETRIFRIGGTVIGFTVRILSPKKWATQLSLFERGNAVHKPVEKLCAGASHQRPHLAATSGHIWPGVSRIEERSIDNSFRAGPHRAPLTHLWNLEQKAKRLEGEISTRRELLVGEGPLSNSALAWERIDMLAADLYRTRQEIERRRAGERMATG